MLHNKSIKKLAELNDFFTSDEKVGNTFIDTLKLFDCGSIKRMLTSIKKRGYGADELLSVLLIFPFMGVSSVLALYRSGLAQFGQARKDAYYRLKNTETIDWRKLLCGFTARFRKLTEEHGSADGVRCLIADDSLLMKTSRFTEGVSRVFDHAARKHLWGFKLMVLGYWDGKCFLPLDFSLHREKGSNKKKPFGMTKREKQAQYSKKRDKNTAGARRKRELDVSKIIQTIRMLGRALKNGIVADYVLTDSWFFSLKLLQCTRSLNDGAVHLISMARMGNAKYEYDGKLYSPAELKQRLKASKKRCRRLKATYITCNAFYQGVDVKMFFVRYAGGKNFRLMVTTDHSLSFIRMMEIYSIRWGIEVFFKEAKQHLQLGKTQSRDLDAQIADATITMIQYVMLSLSKRFSDHETLGRLFEVHGRQLLEATLADRIWGVMVELVRHICDVLEVDPECLLEKLMQEGGSNKVEKLLWRLMSTEDDEDMKLAA